MRKKSVQHAKNSEWSFGNWRKITLSKLDDLSQQLGFIEEKKPAPSAFLPKLFQTTEQHKTAIKVAEEEKRLKLAEEIRCRQDAAEKRYAAFLGLRKEQPRIRRKQPVQDAPKAQEKTSGCLPPITMKR